MLPLGGCGQVVGRYRIVDTLAEQSYAIGFRQDDYVRYYVEAALAGARGGRHDIGPCQHLVHRGQHPLRLQPSARSTSSGAYPAARCSSAATPTHTRLSYIENGQYTGFDVEARARRLREAGLAGRSSSR